MEIIQTILFSSFLALLIISLSAKFKFLFPSKKSHYNNIPPGPSFLSSILRKLPVPPSELVKLSEKYGPIMSFWVGRRHLSVVVSSPSLVKECFTTNDVILANRPKTLVAKHVGYNYSTLGVAPYGAHWQNLRRIFTEQISALSQLNNSSFTRIRKDEVRRLVLKINSINTCSQGDEFKKVEFRSMFYVMCFNILTRMMTGQGHDYCNKRVRKYMELMQEVNDFGGFGSGSIPFRKTSKSDRERKVRNAAEKIDNFMQSLIEEHGDQYSVINTLLSLQKSDPDCYTEEMIKGLLGDVLIPPIGSLYFTLQWAMANLLNNPGVLAKAKEEIDAQVGEDGVLDENAYAKLHYLQNIIWETLRLYPVLPILAPHKSSEECNIGGYHIPGGTMVVVNVLSIHRDPKLWDDPTRFKPERFEKEEVKESCKLLPFGLGRRACPGSRLALRMVGLCLGSLIQCFEWKSVDEEKVDMTVREIGVNLVKARPLEAVCKARPIINKVLNEIE